LNGLRQRFPDCTSFSVANGRGQSFIGASPELLLRVEGRVALTEALAGSAARGATASEDASIGGRLLRSEKDLREQRIVLDSILRSLAPLGLDLKYPGRPLLRRFSNVQHLHTPVEAALPKGVRLLDMLGRLHPTPAVGGTPRDMAVQAIGELEAFPRGLYGGALGWIDSRGDGEFIVGLRSALVDGARARMYAGAGIVAGSSPETEFLETELKFGAMQDALLGA
jgi:menaquinone-specific isochorismate synthase